MNENKPLTPTSTLLRVATASDLARLKAWSEARARSRFSNEADYRFASWSAPWREESLRYYLSLGWSFVIEAAEEGHPVGNAPLLGFGLAQPILFFREQTQTLWIEHIEADAPWSNELWDAFYRLAREKHLQCLLARDGTEGVGERNSKDRWSREAVAERKC